MRLKQPKPYDMSLFDPDKLQAIQTPADMPKTPDIRCAHCGKKAACRVIYDGAWEEYVIAVGCSACGEVQSVALRTIQEPQGERRKLAVSLIENLQSVFNRT